ncbi:hypothetical protein DPEC_G00111730 [Dallia pectoralis]|uniref:Uncharacterized protein n=1 Tax=Dallia pectoralis TaxID=75939 RepID=A0ACC2GT98_DALPE|nr:hypothetical protein DPEC_G00111730 [Dallia pectoralis]
MSRLHLCLSEPLTVWSNERQRSRKAAEEKQKGLRDPCGLDPVKTAGQVHVKCAQRASESTAQREHSFESCGPVKSRASDSTLYILLLTHLFDMLSHHFQNNPPVCQPPGCQPIPYQCMAPYLWPYPSGPRGKTVHFSMREICCHLRHHPGL